MPVRIREGERCIPSSCMSSGMLQLVLDHVLAAHAVRVCISKPLKLLWNFQRGLQDFTALFSGRTTFADLQYLHFCLWLLCWDCQSIRASLPGGQCSFDSDDETLG